MGGKHGWIAVELVMALVLMCQPEQGHLYDVYEEVRKGLTKVPGEIGNDTKVIYLQNNLITSLNDCVFCGKSHLSRVDLFDNLISFISPTAFEETVLDVLNLSNNQLTTVPNLTSVGGTLIYLYLNNNKIASIPDGTFRDLTKLRLLPMSNNFLRDELMGETCFQGLDSIYFIVLSSNSLGRNMLQSLLNSDVLDTAKGLNIAGNNLKHIELALIEEVVCQMPEIKDIVLDDTNLTSVPNFAACNFHPSAWISLEQNPILCDESLVWLKDLKKDQPEVEVYLQCSAPAVLAGRQFSSVLREELKSHDFPTGCQTGEHPSIKFKRLGTNKLPPIGVLGNETTTSRLQCGNRCFEKHGCWSFSYNANTRQCVLSSARLTPGDLDNTIAADGFALYTYSIFDRSLRESWCFRDFNVCQYLSANISFLLSLLQFNCRVCCIRCQSLLP